MPAAATMAAIAWLSHGPLPPGVGLIPDWLGHVGAYAFLAATCAYGTTRGFEARLRTPGRAWTGALIAVVYGALDEWHQSFVGRHMSSADWLGDAFGAAIVAAVLGFLWRDAGVGKGG